MKGEEEGANGSNPSSQSETGNTATTLAGNLTSTMDALKR